MNTVERLTSALGRLRLRMMSRRQVFRHIYRSNNWHNAESRSGHGSTLDATEHLREEIPNIIRDLGISSILDIPCGDFHWMSQVNLGVRYIGADIVPDLIDANRRNYADTGERSFVVLDLVRDTLPLVDLVICRDVFIHLSNSEIAAALANVRRSGAKYILASTYPTLATNKEGQTGHWRWVNLQAAPFCLPEPQRLIREEGAQPTPKFAGLWRVADLKLK